MLFETRKELDLIGGAERAVEIVAGAPTSQ